MFENTQASLLNLQLMRWSLSGPAGPIAAPARHRHQTTHQETNFLCGNYLSKLWTAFVTDDICISYVYGRIWWIPMLIGVIVTLLWYIGWISCYNCGWTVSVIVRMLKSSFEIEPTHDKIKIKTDIFGIDSMQNWVGVLVQYFCDSK